MPRLARKYIETNFLHVMVQGVNKEYIFEKDYEKEEYLKLINESKAQYKLDFLAYCLMSNHAHFAIYTEEKSDLAKFMHEINSKYAKIYNKEKNRCGVLFRNRYQIQPIYSARQLINCINYIHQNPVKANMVTKCEDYKYSSYNDYKMNTGFAKSSILQELFGKNCNFLELFKKDNGKIFMDIDGKTDDEIKEHIIAGTAEFVEDYKVKLQDIFSNRDNLKILINYLKEECGIPYSKQGEFFEMSKGVIYGLRN